MDPRILDGIAINRKWIDYADKVVMARPAANRKHDQIFMMSGAMILQTILMHRYMEGREIVFLGDGDGMSMMFGIFAQKGVFNSPRHMRVLDMDKRILRNINDFAKAEGFSHILETQPYNVFDPIPENLVEQADVFYTNPPYGSKNDGRSGIAFLARCMELTKRKGSFGVAVLPYEVNQPWSISAMARIQAFVTQHGYAVSEMITNLHNYHLIDNPVLSSGYMLVDRVHYRPHPDYGKTLPDELLQKFYGEKVTLLPHYIEENGVELPWARAE